MITLNSPEIALFRTSLENDDQEPFRVVIVGGSVAGLTFVNMLQANDIDYVVLEAYSKIAPQVGASIGMLPHGNRILDQLGAI